MEGELASSLHVAEMVRVDLDGRGVRELRVRDDTLWILAGPADSGDASHVLYRLDSPDAAPRAIAVELPPGSEGMAWTRSDQLVVVTDGDGAPGKPCKAAATWRHVDLP